MWTHDLFEELNDISNKALHFGMALKNLDDSQLNFRQHQNQWSILECLEHLNLYGDHYLTEIETILSKSKKVQNKSTFKGSLLGNYFVKIIKPKKGSSKKMKTASAMNPLNKKLDKTTIDRFILQQEHMLLLLKKSKNYSLVNIKIPTTLSRFLYLSLGDTLRFVVFHTKRHLLQASQLLQNMNIEYKF